MTTKLILLVHLLTMVGTLGGLLFVQLGLSATTRNSSEVAGKAARFFSSMIAIGFLAGLALYIQMIHAAKAAGVSLTGHIHGIIGAKFAMLIVAGGLLGMSGKSAKGDLFRSVAIVLLILASFFGMSL